MTRRSCCAQPAQVAAGQTDDAGLWGGAQAAGVLLQQPLQTVAAAGTEGRAQLTCV